MYILETKRLVLRHFIMSDLGEIYDLVYADTLVKNAWSGAADTPDEIKQRFAEKYILPEGKFGLGALLLKDTGTLISLVGFQRHEPGEGAAPRTGSWYAGTGSGVCTECVIGFGRNVV